MNGISQVIVIRAGPFARFWSSLRGAFIFAFNDGCFGFAKGAAYSALLAFLPVLGTVLTILVRANAEAVAGTLARLVFDAIPPGTQEVVQNIFVARGEQPISLLVAAVFLSAWAGSGVMMSLMDGFRAIYRIPAGRSMVKERGMALLLVLIAVVPLLGASALIVMGNQARARILVWLGVAGDPRASGGVEIGGHVITFLIAAAAIVFATSLVFYFGPNRKQRFAQVIPGAVLATLLWLLATLAFGWYVREIADYNVLYGSLGAGMALLVWSYLLALIMLVGCEFNAVRETEIAI